MKGKLRQIFVMEVSGGLNLDISPKYKQMNDPILIPHTFFNDNA